ncbi:MAG: hypothetical protein LBQ05_02765 [Christensenellaceae bacterium]|jgi:hypothetical protein|nr:hypothetical protein [Christensenellaceae bacterium]
MVKLNPNPTPNPNFSWSENVTKAINAQARNNYGDAEAVDVQLALFQKRCDLLSAAMKEAGELGMPATGESNLRSFLTNEWDMLHRRISALAEEKEQRKNDTSNDASLDRSN